MEDKHEFEDLKEFIKYQARTKKQLNKLKTDRDFTKAFGRELREQGLDIDVLNKFLEIERNKAFELVDRFSKGELKHWGLKDLNDELINLVCDSEYVYGVNERYSDLTNKNNDFYRQYSRFMQDVCGKLLLEIAYRMNYGGNRNMGDR